MLSKALNQPKKWGWLLETEELDNNERPKLTMEGMINILNMAPQKELYASSLFKKGKKKKVKLDK